MRCVLGVDPGSRFTGYGIIRITDTDTEYVESGCIRTTQGGLPFRLAEIYQGIDTLITHHQPTEFAIEEVFLAKNPASALTLGQARGCAIAAAVAHGLPISEYAARRVKQAVTGTGAATKEQIQHMVRVLLHLPGAPSTDAADALAIAICHVNTQASETDSSGS